MTSPITDIVELARDAARFRWLLATAPGLLAQIAWSVKAACAHGDPVEAIDAAMEQDSANQ